MIFEGLPPSYSQESGCC